MAREFMQEFMTNKERLEDFLEENCIDEGDAVKLLFEIARRKSRGHLKALLCELPNELAYEGYIVYKTETQKESTQIIEAIQNICPGYREQKEKLFYEN
jgi:L-lactate utilization protein LutB